MGEQDVVIITGQYIEGCIKGTTLLNTMLNTV